MTATHGFELLRERKLPEINTTARHYRHVKTGAELLSLLNDDENKVFGVTFARRRPIRRALLTSSNIRCCAGRANIPSRSRSSS